MIIKNNVRQTLNIGLSLDMDSNIHLWRNMTGWGMGRIGEGKGVSPLML